MQNEDGLFVFEILPNDEIPPMAMKDNEDESILKIDLEGKVVDESGEEVEEGEPIYILDDNGELMALAYTTNFGNFKFSEISPNATYKLKMNEDDRSLSLVIYDGEEEITVPMNNKNEAVYERASENEGIEIVDESNKKINIRNDEKFVVDNIYYATDEYRLNVISMRELNSWVTILKKNPNVKIELTSHTDSRGEDVYNLKLSDRRAQNAKDYLVEKGISENRIIARGMGEKELLNRCDDEADCEEDEHAINRRTEIRIFAAEK
jgi:outer membrane protein OmpA-like peptidoglycan-associated protein